MEWVFTNIPEEERAEFLALWLDQDFIKVAEIINKYRVSPTRVCCGFSILFEWMYYEIHDNPNGIFKGMNAGLLSSSIE